MRPPRLLVLLFCFIALPVILTLISLLSTHPQRDAASSSTVHSRSSGISALFSFHTPSSLFPPSAIISLTDDNSTFFLARPAAFGPLLPSRGLRGQLWVGSGFGDDNWRRGGMVEGAEGELGCSDVPGWGEGDKQPGGDTGADKDSSAKINTGLSSTSNKKPTKGAKGKREVATDDDSIVLPAEISHDDSVVDDGTDDYLHHPLPGSELSKPAKPGQPAQHESTNEKSTTPQHADIQSLQESAEIAGKIVLLSRGGCGFLEKVKWAQRRGGVAIIIGDDTRGGGLVTMYAHGDTSNVTIPSLFTSHTTAHLLSSLIPDGGYIEDYISNDSIQGASKEENNGQERTKRKSGRKTRSTVAGPTFTPTSGSFKAANTPRPTNVAMKKQPHSTTELESPFQRKESTNWFRSLLSVLGFGRGVYQPSGMAEDSRRPPSSGHINWVLVDDDTDQSPNSHPSTQLQGNDGPSKSDETKKTNSLQGTGSQPSSGDDFVIGVQDWRDPDLVATRGSSSSFKSSAGKINDKSKTLGRRPTQSMSAAAKKIDSLSETGKPRGSGRLEGGSITPGSGEYERPESPSTGSKSTKQGASSSTLNNGDSLNSEQHDNERWHDRLPWSGSGSKTGGSKAVPEHNYVPSYTASEPAGSKYDEDLHDEDDEYDDVDDHDGLWITLTPTSMSTSPFFDTILVLVVSPLVTLTVVYALLLLRSRIRRRRWRAPKSVVDRLPVRTYHTISRSSSSISARQINFNGSSPASPLLQSSNRSTSPRSRPRSQTTTGVPEQITPLEDSSTDNPLPEAEKPQDGAIQWRRRYNGKQVECVVCLEEYVDGVSRVMSLPCGHEFHAECITPWLTTRRRTCPICKGDVVRSMARGSPSNSRFAPYHDEPEEDIQTRAAETTNDSPSSAIPIPRNIVEEADLERGDESAATLINDRPPPTTTTTSNPRTVWRGLANLSLAAFSGEAAWRQAQADRNR
ncbi:MAG: hypothetical protein M1827_007270 [Pycnora praestabilis]|nr:MAG: hypothetical protein M1827_007270 [Pycnora praestabilis]